MGRLFNALAVAAFIGVCTSSYLIPGVSAGSSKSSAIEPKIERHGSIAPKIQVVSHFRIPKSPGLTGVNAIAWSPDGAAITAFGNETFAVWDRSGHVINTFPRGNGLQQIGSFAFTNGESQLLFWPPGDPQDFALATWQVSTGAIASKIRHDLMTSSKPNAWHNQVYCFAVSTDQRVAAVGSLNHPVVAIFDTAQWTPIRTVNVTHGARSLRFFSSGHRLVVGSWKSTFTILDADTGTVEKQFTAPNPANHRFSGVTALALSPDGKYLLAGIEYEIPVPHTASFMLAGTVELFHTDTGDLAASFDRPLGEIWDASWDPKDRFVVFTSDTPTTYRDHSEAMYVWQPLRDSASYTKVTFPFDAFRIAMEPDGSRLAINTNDGIDLYELN